MTNSEYYLDASTPVRKLAPLNIYCSRSKCNIIIPKGDPVLYFDAATMTHVSCPTRRLRNFAPHKQPGFTP